MIKIRKLKESVENQIQKFVDNYCQREGIPSIKIAYTDKQLRGSAYYSSHRYKNDLKIYSEYIMIGEWSIVKKYPDEWMFSLAHELSHHITAMKFNSLKHNNKQKKITDEIEQEFKKFFLDKNKIDKEKLKSKIDYWIKNKDEIIRDNQEAGLIFDYEKELQTMKDKLK
ncbi:hypothetical protein LCGC14_2438330 [marine sediment metagenome]|uniref:SprT-like domain-containing protein n=1 Tax=marine sediment metagenome TaxID=412755 RepID=A0A0F9DWQ7_9ZZZZ